MTSRAQAERNDPCPDDDAMLALVAGTLEKSVDRRIQRHLVDCQDCRGLLAALARSGERPVYTSELTATKVGNPRRQDILFERGELVANRYVIQRFVARGGMGEVYDAEDVELSERVALKTVRRELLADPDAIARLKREVSVMRKVAHPSVCRIAEFGEHVAEDGRVPFFTMEFIEGETLGQRVRRTGALAFDEALAMATQIARAIDAVHRAGIIHRDLKSSNVLLAAGGRVVVTDFGLAKVALSSSTLTQGDFLGSPPYVSPEQVEGKEAGAASDIYSFGVVLYEMITGALPFSAATPLLTIMKRLSHPPEPLEVHRPDVPAIWSQVVLTCLNRAPEARYANAMEAIDMLRGVSDVRSSRVGTRPPPPPAARLSPRRPRWMAVALAAGALGIAFVLGAFFMRRRPAPSSQADAARASVAIVELRNLAKRTDVAWLSTAFSEILSSELGSSELRVVTGERVARAQRDLALPDRDFDSADAVKLRENLSADWIVTGSFTVVGDERDGRVRVDLRLHDARNGTVAQRFNDEGPRSSLLELAHRLGGSLRASVGVFERSANHSVVTKTPPQTAEGLRLYAEGIQFARGYEYKLATERFTQLTGLEPRYALGHAELAATWSELGEQRKAASEATLAYQLSGALPEDERSRIEALGSEVSSDYASAVETYRRLWEKHHDDIGYGASLARVQIRLGRPQDASQTVAEMQRVGGDADTLVTDQLGAHVARASRDSTQLTRAARRLRERANARGARRLVAEADRFEGMAAAELGRCSEALEFYTRAHRGYLEVGDAPSAANVVDDIANVWRTQGRLEESLKLFHEVAAAKRAMGQVRGLGVELNNIGTAETLLGHYDEAVRAFEESLACSETVNVPSGIEIARSNLAEIYVALERFEEAQGAYERVLEKATLLGDRRLEVRGLLGLGVVANRLGNFAEATRLTSRAQRTAEAFHVGTLDLTAIVFRSEIDFETGDLEGARTRLMGAFERLKRSEDQELLLVALPRLANLQLASGDLVAARGTVDDAHKTMATLDPTNPRLATLTRLDAELDLASGVLDRARALATRAALSVETAKLPGESARSHALLARVLAMSGDMPGARAELDQAAAAAARSSDPRSKLSVGIARALCAKDRTELTRLQRSARTLGFSFLAVESDGQFRRMLGARANAKLH